MATDLSRYIVNPGPKKPVTGLAAAVTTDTAIVTETMLTVLKAAVNAADAGIAGALVQAPWQDYQHVRASEYWVGLAAIVANLIWTYRR